MFLSRVVVDEAYEMVKDVMLILLKMTIRLAFSTERDDKRAK
jgi:hypothetical protein